MTWKKVRWLQSSSQMLIHLSYNMLDMHSIWVHHYSNFKCCMEGTCICYHLHLVHSLLLVIIHVAQQDNLHLVLVGAEVQAIQHYTHSGCLRRWGLDHWRGRLPSLSNAQALYMTKYLFSNSPNNTHIHTLTFSPVISEHHNLRKLLQLQAITSCEEATAHDLLASIRVGTAMHDYNIHVGPLANKNWTCCINMSMLM